MDKLDALITSLKELDTSIIDTIKQVIQDNAVIIEEMNTVVQLDEEGVNRLGVKISSYAPYSPMTISIKREKGQPTSRVTLRDTGEFHKSFYIEFHPDGFEIKASDWKANVLTKEYGPEIFGLTDENFNDLAINYIAPAIEDLFKSI